MTCYFISLIGEIYPDLFVVVGFFVFKIMSKKKKKSGKNKPNRRGRQNVVPVLVQDL